MALAFDTLRAATRLREAGFKEEQARALVTIFAEAASATLGAEDDLDKSEPALGTEIGNPGAKFDRLEVTMSAECAALLAEMRVMKRDIIIWLGGLYIALTGLVIAATSVLG